MTLDRFPTNKTPRSLLADIATICFAALFFGILVSGLYAAIILSTKGPSKEDQEQRVFMQQCLQDKPESHCAAIWRWR